jgi:hypothetical protein
MGKNGRTMHLAERLADSEFSDSFLRDVAVAIFIALGTREDPELAGACPACAGMDQAMECVESGLSAIVDGQACCDGCFDEAVGRIVDITGYEVEHSATGPSVAKGAEMVTRGAAILADAMAPEGLPIKDNFVLGLCILKEILDVGADVV